MKVNFNYSFTLGFAKSVSNHAFCVRIVPMSNAIQTLMSYDLHINDKQDFSHTFDGFGNNLTFGEIIKPHRTFRAYIEGEVSLKPYKYQDMDNPLLYLHPSLLIPFSPLVMEFAHSLSLPLGDFEKALWLSEMICRDFTYIKDVSTTTSDADALLLRKKGVCQDFSHLLVALLRLNHIPARYVNGLIDGEGETHAWVEAYIDGYWQGFDPTHGVVLTHEPHIKIAHGRDFFDCRLNRGTFAGGGNQTLHVSVSVSKDEQ